MDYNYGILAYNSVNIGDDIQSVAAMRFLPRIDEYIHREQIDKFKTTKGKRTKLIMNAWWTWTPKKFPPSDYIAPLLISMHIRPKVRKKILTAKTKNYFLQNGPVGCRDLSTFEWLQHEGIPAYYSGCLTVTLQRNYKIPRQNYILCVDTSDAVTEVIKKSTGRPVYSVSRMLSSYYNSQQRLELAKLMLRLYHDAHLVVSSRLHVIMPSLALETPVLRIISNENEMGETSRYMGIENFFNSVDLNKGIDELAKYDFDTPLSNPQNHLAMRANLIKKCSEFTGYNNQESLINENINPFVELLKLNTADKNFAHAERSAYFLKTKKLGKILLKRLTGTNRYFINDSFFKR